MDKNIIYVYLKDKVQMRQGCKISLKDIADIWAPDNMKGNLEKIDFGVFNADEYLNINSITVIEKIKNSYCDYEISISGNSEVWVTKIKQTKKKNKFLHIGKIAFVCFILFIGGAVAIMNFHADVDMPIVQQNVYRIITGKQTKHPIFVSIPYSIGIGIGIAIFFNQFSYNESRKDPSPLELEMFNYRKNLDDYKKEENENPKGK